MFYRMIPMRRFSALNTKMDSEIDAAEGVCCLFDFHGDVLEMLDEAITAEGGDPMRCEITCFETGDEDDLVRCQVTCDGAHVCYLWIQALSDTRCRVSTDQDEMPWEDPESPVSRPDSGASGCSDEASSC